MIRFKNQFFPLLLLFHLLHPVARAESPFSGYRIHSDSRSMVWWIENTYKVMKDSPLPVKKRMPAIQSARNETEAFQLVITPISDMKDARISINPFVHKDGYTIPEEAVEIRLAEYVQVTKPSGPYQKPGWYPDPLPAHNRAFNLKADENQPVWISVYVPANAVPGIYTALLTICTEGQPYLTIPIQLEVWNFTLPEIPAMRSAFGLYTGMLKQYHHTQNEEELKQLTHKYYQYFRKYKLSPQQFHDLYPIRKKVTGADWQGGTYDPDTVFRGRYSLQVTDRSAQSNTDATFRKLLPVDPQKAYLVKWHAKSLKPGSHYCVSVKCYDQSRNPIHWSVKGMIFPGSSQWKADSLLILPDRTFAINDMVIFRPFPPETRFASIHLYPCQPDMTGSATNTVWFDELAFTDQATGFNLLPQGDFEQDIRQLRVVLDFSSFDEGARKYLDGFGFTGFRIKFDELKPGPFAGRKAGWFHGFIDGTPEYKKLITSYLKQVQDHLEANGWLGKEYIYWIDEPKQEEYWFVRRGMEIIHEAAPKLTRLITENNPGPGIMDVTEIACPVFTYFDPGKSKEWMDKGKNIWSYLMTWPKAPHLNLFIDDDAINMRMWLWMSYRYNLTGILMWCSNYWNTASASPPGVLQDKWKDPMVYWGNQEVPWGAAAEFGNGDGVFFYPPKRNPNTEKSPDMGDPIPSIRLELLREGLDDYDYMKLLEKCLHKGDYTEKKWINAVKGVLTIGPDVFINEKEYTRDPKVLMRYREQMAALLNAYYRKR